MIRILDCFAGTRNDVAGKIVISSVALFIFFASLSSIPAQPLHQGEWRTYTAMDSITDLAINPATGNIWAASWGGAFRFNPQSPKTDTLALRNSDGLSDNNLTAVAADPSGKIYFGGNAGTIDIYNETSKSVTSIRDIALATQYAQRKIYQISIFGSRLYFSTGFGLSIYDTILKSFTVTIPHFGSLREQDTVFASTEFGDSIYAVLSGAIAIAAKNAQNLSDPFAWRIVQAPTGTTLNSIATFQSKIITGGQEGIYSLESDTLRFIAMKDSISVMKMIVSGNSLYILDSRNNKLIASNDLLSFSSSLLPGDNNEKNISAFIPPNANGSAFGYGIGGVVFQPVSGNAFTGIFPDGPLSNDISHLHFAGSLGKLFACFNTIGISAFDAASSKWVGYATKDGKLPAASYTSSFYDSVHSKLWLSASGTPALFALASASIDSLQSFGVKEGIEPYNPNGSDPFTVMGAGTMDNHNNFMITSWAGSGKSILLSKDGKTFTSLQLNPPINPPNPFGVCVQDLDDIYYAATINFQNPSPFGISVYNTNGSTQNILGGSGQNLSSASINALLVDQDNGLWCGTNTGVQIVTHSFDQSGNPVYHNPARVLVFTDQQIVHAIAVDGVGNKWVGTDNGVFVLSADGSDSLAHFTTSNSPLIDNSIQTIAIDIKNGEAYLGTHKGISRLSSIYQEGAANYSGMYIYPNPVIQHSDDAIKVTITGLAGGSTVKIFTVSGKLVATIDGTQLGSTVTWNGRDDSGKLLTSGVYIAAAASPVTTDYGQTKFVFIRK